MRHLQENSKTLDKVMAKLLEEMRRNLKFTSQRIPESQIIKMCCDQLGQSLINLNPNKQNQNSNLPANQENPQHAQIKYLKKKLQIQHQLSRQMFIQVNRDKFTFGSQMLQTRQVPVNRLLLNVPLTESIRQGDNMVQNVPLINSLTRQIPGVRSIKDSCEGNNRTASSNRGNRLISSSRRTGIDNCDKSEKRKTFSKLRKLQNFFCAQTPTNKMRRNSLANSCWVNKLQQEHQILTEQNQNLKSIQNNLVTHLNMLQKYKHIPSLQTLVEQQQTLNRKQDGLKYLQEQLQRKQLQLNRIQSDAVRRRQSFQAQ